MRFDLIGERKGETLSSYIHTIFKNRVNLCSNKLYGVCLLILSLFNSLMNVRKHNNRLDLVDDQGNHEEIYIPEGAYEVTDIINAIRDKKFNSLYNVERKNIRFDLSEDEKKMIPVPEGIYDVDNLESTIKAKEFDKLSTIIQKREDLHLDKLLDKECRHYIHIPGDKYKVEDILQAIKERRCAADKLKMNLTPYTHKVKIISEGKKVDFSVPNSICRVLGYSERVLEKDVTHHSDRMIDIFPLTAIQVKCNLVNTNYENGEGGGGVIYSHPWSAPTGEKYWIIPYHYLYYEINTHSFREIVVQIVDQDGNLLDFGDEKIYVALDIREM